jgi:ribosomal-protein-alanine N-acetyltransferase
MTNLKVRWALRSDLPKMVAIEEQTKDLPWDSDEICHQLAKKNCIGVVLLKNNSVIGHVFYLLHQREIEIINLVVAAKFQRKGCGKHLISYVKSKLKSLGVGKKDRVTAMVSDRDLSAHLFLKAVGFRAIRVEPNAMGLDNDGYFFACGPEPVPEPEVVQQQKPKEKKTRGKR